MKTLLLSLFFILNSYGQIENAGETILSHFQCGQGVETSNVLTQMNGLKELANSLQSDNSRCNGYKDQFNNIPEVETLIDTLFNNREINEIQKIEREIKELESELDFVSSLPQDADERNWMASESEIQNQIYLAKGRLIEFKKTLKEDELDLQFQNASNRIYEVERYFDNLTAAIDDDCFSENPNLAVTALSSVASIAGLFSNSQWGLAATVGSKLLSKVVDVSVKNFKARKKNKINNIVKPIELLNGVECAIKSFSQGQCRLLNKARVYGLVEEKSGKFDDHCYGGITSLSNTEKLYGQAAEVLNKYRASVNNTTSGDERSDKNRIEIVNYQKYLIAFETSLNSERRKYENNLRKGVLDEATLKYELAFGANNQNAIFSNGGQKSGSFEILKSFLDSTTERKAAIKRNYPEFVENAFLTILYGESDPSRLASLKSSFLAMKKEQQQQGFGNTFNPSNYDGVSSLEMFDSLIMAFRDDSSKSLKPNTPDIVRDIYSKLADVSNFNTIEGALEGFSNTIEKSYPILSSKIGEIDKSNTVQTFVARKGDSNNLSPIEAMDDLINNGERILTNRELLKKNMLSKKEALKEKNIELSNELEGLSNLKSKKAKNLSFILKSNEKQIKTLENDVELINGYGYQDLVKSISDMREARDESLKKWENFKRLRSGNQSDAEVALRKMRGETVSSTDKYSQEEIQKAEDEFIRSIDKYMNYDTASSNANNFLVIEKHLSMNNELWGQQLENLFNVPGELEDTFFLMRSDVFKDYLGNIDKFYENKKDIDKALAASSSLVKQNSVLFGPYLEKINKKLSKVKLTIDPKTLGSNKPLVKKGFNDKSYKQAEINEYKEFCLNVLGASEVPASIKESCSGLKWELLNGASLSFENASDMDFESRSCLPRMIENSLQKQRALRDLN